MSQPDEPAPDPFRVYANVGPDGYPLEWHATIKHLTRDETMERLGELLALERIA